MSLLPDEHRRGQLPAAVAPPVPTNGGAKRVYVFAEDGAVSARRREVLRCLCGMMATFSFGIMLGWPAPTYPSLLDPIYTTYPFDPAGNFSIPSDPGAALRGPFSITLVQSPLIAGLLMVGVIVATPFSSRAYTMHSIKHGLLVALLAMMLGWIVLWQACNIFHLLVSRLLIGLANGYAVGQVKVYIQDSPLTPWCKGLMTKMANMVMMAGVICAYVMGIWLGFQGFAIGALLITAAFYLATCFLPLAASRDHALEFVEIPQDREGLEATAPRPQGVCALFRTPHLRRSTWLLVGSTFVQQFAGAPATIVYSHVLLLNMGLPPAQVPALALLYLLVYAAAYAIGTFYCCALPHATKRRVLLASIVMSILALVLLILILRLNLRAVDAYLPLVGMCLYIVAYALGLGTIPNTFAEHLFSAQWRRCAGELQLMCFAGFAVIITKLLQVFLGEFALECAFMLFLGVAASGLAFVQCCLPRKPLH